MVDADKRTAARLQAGAKSVLRPLYRKMRPLQSDRASTIDIGSFGGFEVAYRRGTADERVIGHSFDHDIFFTGVPEFTPREDDVILDIGAHIGTFSLLAGAKVLRGQVHAIEASRDSFNLLKINVALNHASNVHAHHLALADRNGTIELFHATGNWEHSLVKQSSRSSETVPCLTLENFLTDQHIEQCAFVKFNVEGAEFPIILGTSADVLQRIGAMLVLYHCDLWRENTEQDLLDHLRASGFTCAVREQTESRGWIIATRK